MNSQETIKKFENIVLLRQCREYNADEWFKWLMWYFNGGKN